MTDAILTDLVTRLIILLVLAFLGGIAIFIATELTAKSELLAPFRRWLIRAGGRATVRRDPDNTYGRHGAYGGPPRWYDRIVIFFTDAWTCPFCSSFWHGFWVAAVVFTLVGPGWAALTYPLSVGIAKLLHDGVSRGKGHGRER